MARSKFSTLTEQMYYVLLCLKDECCGMEIMDKVSNLTNGRVQVGSGTLYNLLEQFLDSITAKNLTFQWNWQRESVQFPNMAP